MSYTSPRSARSRSSSSPRLMTQNASFGGYVGVTTPPDQLGVLYNAGTGGISITQIDVAMLGNAATAFDLNFFLERPGDWRTGTLDDLQNLLPLRLRAGATLVIGGSYSPAALASSENADLVSLKFHTSNPDQGVVWFDILGIAREPTAKAI